MPLPPALRHMGSLLPQAPLWPPCRDPRDFRFISLLQCLLSHLRAGALGCCHVLPSVAASQVPDEASWDVLQYSLPACSFRQCPSFVLGPETPWDI